MNATRYRTRSGWRWKARWDVAVPAGMPRRQASKGGFTSKAAALAHAAEQSQQPRARRSTSMTLGAWLDAWQPDVGPATADTYRRTARNYVAPVLGSVRVSELGDAHVHALTDELTRRGLSSKTVANAYGVLRSALRDAGVQPPNATPPAPRSAEMDCWDRGELRAWLSVAEGDDLGALWRLAATTGMRRGELCALRAEDVSASAVHVRRSMTDAGGRLREKTPKSRAGTRRLSVDGLTAKMLADQAASLAPSARLWPVAPNSLTKRFPRTCDKADVRRIRLHDLRHTYATLALSACRTFADVKTLSRRLGHASVQITLDTYSHVIPAQDSELASAVADML